MNIKIYIISILGLSIMNMSPAANNSSNFQTIFNLANQQFKDGNSTDAINSYELAIAEDPTCPQAYFNLGLAYQSQQKYDKALENFEAALARDQAYAKAYFHAGQMAHNKNDFNKAINYLNKHLEFNPRHADTIRELGKCLSSCTKLDAAIEKFQEAHQLNPYDVNITLDLANTYNMVNQTEKALSFYYKILEQVPNNSSVLYNVAYTLKKLGKIDQAIPIYKKVLELDPENAEAHFSLGLAYLISGDFENGWPEYEWRWKRSNHAGTRDFKQPLWDGTPLNGKTILIHAEQGLGDTFQFVRYAKIVKEKGGKVIAAVQSPLVQILSLCPYIDKVMPLFENMPHFDVQIPMVSLPYILKTRLDSVPHEIPYLYADPKLTALWKEKLSVNKNFKIGICFQGNSNYSTHFLRTVVAAKSIELKKLSPLFATEKASFYNLQKVTGEHQLADLNPTVSFITFDADFDNKNGRFMDTAAVMLNLDLMITVDTSIAHLAGGLGIPVWVMMPEPSDWRWLLKCSDTPWYPNMRIFRQPTPGDWDSVLTKIIAELTLIIDAHNKTNHIELHVNKRDMLSETIKQLYAQLHDKEQDRVVDQAYQELALELYRALEEQKKL